MGRRTDTYRYHFIVDGKIVYRNITKDLVRREKELQRTWPAGKIKQIGGKTLYEAALHWERNGGKAK